MLQRVLKTLPDRASGPDAVSAQMLRSVPPLALTPLLNLFKDMETQAELPTQMSAHGRHASQKPEAGKANRAHIHAVACMVSSQEAPAG